MFGPTCLVLHVLQVLHAFKIRESGSTLKWQCNGIYKPLKVLKHMHFVQNYIFNLFLPFPASNMVYFQRIWHEHGGTETASRTVTKNSFLIVF